MKKALVIVDYQNDFIDGSLGFKEAEDIKPELLKICDEALEDFVDLIFTKDCHFYNYLSTTEGREIPVVHCVKGSKGWALPHSFDKFLEKAVKVFEKSSFASVELIDFLKENSYTHIDFAGLVLDKCVFINAVLAKSLMPEVCIAIRKKATASPDKEAFEAALKSMQNIGIKVFD